MMKRQDKSDMSQRDNNNAKSRHKRQGRLVIVAELYKKGYSIAKIAEEVRARLNSTCSTRTVWNDINYLLKEWQETRVRDIDAAVQLELERIDDAVRELWEQWDKSKTDYTKTASKQKGNAVRDNQTGATTIRTNQAERTETEVVRLGDPAYVAEIRQQLSERRKLLGLYAPEKKDVSGNMSFASFLIESGMLDEAERQAGE